MAEKNVSSFCSCIFMLVRFLVCCQWSEFWSQIRLVVSMQICPGQRAKKVVSDSPGLVDFAIGLVNSVFNLPDGQVMFFEELE